MLACTLIGLKWFVRFEPDTPNRTEYLSFTLKSLVTRASTEKLLGNRDELGVPTYCWVASNEDHGKPDRYSTFGITRNLWGKSHNPPGNKSIGRLAGQKCARVGQYHGRGKVREICIELIQIAHAIAVDVGKKNLTFLAGAGRRGEFQLSEARIAAAVQHKRMRRVGHLRAQARSVPRNGSSR